MIKKLFWFSSVLCSRMPYSKIQFQSSTEATLQQSEAAEMNTVQTPRTCSLNPALSALTGDWITY